jgi:hypothetical protein
VVIFEVEVLLDDGSEVMLEVMACDRHEAQVMAIQELTERLQRPASAKATEQ